MELLMPDGKQFTGVVDSGQAQSGPTATPQIQVVLNWFEELKQRVPVHWRRRMTLTSGSSIRLNIVNSRIVAKPEEWRSFAPEQSKSKGRVFTL